jgi:hypothetical protein
MLGYKSQVPATMLGHKKPISMSRLGSKITPMARLSMKPVSDIVKNVSSGLERRILKR